MIVDAFSTRKKNDVMKDTWGHLYPEPGSKHPGTMLITYTDYRELVVIRADFPTLLGGPIDFELIHSIFDYFEIEELESGGIYKIDCTLWFYKGCSNMYIGSPVGKIIKIKTKKLDI